MVGEAELPFQAPGGDPLIEILPLFIGFFSPLTASRLCLAVMLSSSPENPAAAKRIR